VLAAFGEGIDLAGHNGAYLLIGLWSGHGTTPVDPIVFVHKNHRIIRSCFIQPEHYHRAMHLSARLEQQLRLPGIITHRFDVFQADEALGTVENGLAVKAVIQPATQAAALAGVRTPRIILFALVASGVVAGVAGLLLNSQLSTGDPTVGPGYLLPVIAAVFLGSTQFRGGRFNIWGTVVAACTRAGGVKGLQLAGLPIWIPDLFNGAALLVAVGLAVWRRTPATRRTGPGRFVRLRRAARQPAETEHGRPSPIQSVRGSKST